MPLGGTAFVAFSQGKDGGLAASFLASGWVDPSIEYPGRILLRKYFVPGETYSADNTHTDTEMFVMLHPKASTQLVPSPRVWIWPGILHV